MILIRSSRDRAWTTQLRRCRRLFVVNKVAAHLLVVGMVMKAGYCYRLSQMVKVNRAVFHTGAILLLTLTAQRLLGKEQRDL